MNNPDCIFQELWAWSSIDMTDYFIHSLFEFSKSTCNLLAQVVDRLYGFYLLLSRNTASFSTRVCWTTRDFTLQEIFRNRTLWSANILNSAMKHSLSLLVCIMICFLFSIRDLIRDFRTHSYCWIQFFFSQKINSSEWTWKIKHWTIIRKKTTSSILKIDSTF